LRNPWIEISALTDKIEGLKSCLDIINKYPDKDAAINSLILETTDLRRQRMSILEDATHSGKKSKAVITAPGTMPF
jgi:hypothetical protein